MDQPSQIISDSLLLVIIALENNFHPLNVVYFESQLTPQQTCDMTTLDGSVVRDPDTAHDGHHHHLVVCQHGRYQDGVPVLFNQFIMPDYNVEIISLPRSDSQFCCVIDCSLETWYHIHPPRSSVFGQDSNWINDFIKNLMKQIRQIF